MISLIRDSTGADAWFEPICVIEHTGMLEKGGRSAGHYICDIKEKSTKQWYRTSDDSYPSKIDVDEVSAQGYAILFKRYDI